jgi:poly(3-hydroxybutyrate) depolymerase
MLYTMHELSRAMMRPWVYASEATAKMFSAPESWLSRLPGAERIAATHELLYRIGKGYEKPQFGFTTIAAHGHVLPVVELEVARKPFCRLLRFKRYSDDAQVVADLHDDPKVLVVAPLSGHHSTLLRDTVG